jgi:hypothetical protein
MGSTCRLGLGEEERDGLAALRPRVDCGALEEKQVDKYMELDRGRGQRRSHTVINFSSSFFSSLLLLTFYLFIFLMDY